MSTNKSSIPPGAELGLSAPTIQPLPLGPLRGMCGVSEAMRRAAPSEENARKAYSIGSLAAANRRTNPVTTPVAWDTNPTRITNDTDNYSLIAKDLPYLASPIVEHVRADMPDLVMAADRGGRLLGLAVFKVWRQRYPNAPFPTIDGKLHFGRISKSVDDDVAEKVVQMILHRSGVSAEIAQRNAEGDARPIKVLFLDDWIAGGGTVSLTRKCLLSSRFLTRRNLDLTIGTMVGRVHSTEKHIVGHPGRFCDAIWSDDSQWIGVQYGYQAEKAARGFPVRGNEARQLRKDLTSEVIDQIPPSPHLQAAPSPNYYWANRKLSRSQRLYKKIANHLI